MAAVVAAARQKKEISERRRKASAENSKEFSKVRFARLVAIACLKACRCVGVSAHGAMILTANSVI